MVEVDVSNIFFNKKYNLIYGKFLRKMLEKNQKIKIICYKQPHFIHKVNYSNIVNELWEAEIDTTDKKKIANISFGMLEKSRNTAQRSYVFNTLREACHYQKESGGRIYALQEETVDDEKRTMGNTYYILNTTARKTLMNGFRYIKELLLQYHNYSMYEAYNILNENNIKVYSVKSDAFTIHEDDLTRVMGKPNHFIKTLREGLLNFDEGIGNWRLTNKNVNFPSDKYKFKYNTLIEIPKIENEEIDVVDEWDTPAICNQIMQQKPNDDKGKICRKWQELHRTIL